MFDVKRRRIIAGLKPVAWSIGFGTLLLAGVVTEHLRAASDGPAATLGSGFAVTRSADVMGAITGDPSIRNFVVEKVEARRPGKTHARFLVVEVNDLSGNYLANIVWNADNGSFVAVNQCLPNGGDKTSRPMDAQQAKSSAKQFVASLSIGNLSNQIQILQRPERYGSLWFVTVQSAKEATRVCIEANTGRLQFAVSCRPS